MSDTPIYGVVLDFQRPEIEAYCFGLCGKIIVGSMTLREYGMTMTLLPCKQTECPYLHSQTDEPIGEVDGQPVILRRLVDAPQKGGEG